jgi:hypothetical protein
MDGKRRLRGERMIEEPSRKATAGDQIFRAPRDARSNHGALKVRQEATDRAPDVPCTALEREETYRHPVEVKDGDLDIRPDCCDILDELGPEIRAVQGRLGLLKPRPSRNQFRA